MTFLITQANAYIVMSVPEGFLSGGEYDIHINSAGLPADFSPISNDTLNDLVRTAEKFCKRFGNFERLSAQDYPGAYLTQYAFTKGDLLVVQNSF